MAHREVAGCVVLVTGMLVVSACGGSGDDAAATPAPSEETAVNSAPPPEAEGGDPLEQDPGSAPGLPGARAALKAFLQGQAAGDPSVCRYVAADSEFVKGPALRGDCEKGVKDTPKFLRPRERQALSQVQVNGGELSEPDEAVLPFSGLRWSAGHMTERTLQPEFVLRRNDESVWQIVR